MLRQYELVERVLAYDPDADEAMLNRAYVYTVQKHGTQKRASGDLVALKVNFEIFLKDFDIKGKEGVIGKSVGEKITCEVDLFANS